MLLRAFSLLGGELAAVLGGDLRLAQDIDPVSFDVRETQVEALLRWGRSGEAVLVARDTQELFPGSSQAQSAYATAAVMDVLHGGPTTPGEAEAAARRALDLDPASTRSVERLMFLLAARRTGLQEFQALGLRRARLIGNGVVALEMKCRLCGRHWLKHRPGGPSIARPVVLRDS